MSVSVNAEKEQKVKEDEAFAEKIASKVVKKLTDQNTLKNIVSNAVNGLLDNREGKKGFNRG